MSNTTDQNTALDTKIQETATNETAQETTNHVNDDPWATTDTSTTDVDPWGAGSGTENIDTSSAGSDWLDAAPTDVAPDSFNLMAPISQYADPIRFMGYRSD